MVVHYLIAGSLAQAKETAKTLNWSQVAPAVYRNEQGEDVKITEGISFLDYGFRGSRDFTLYLGYGWQKLPAQCRARMGEMAPILEVKIVELEV